MPTLKDQIEALAARSMAGYINFESFDIEPIIKSTEIQICYDASIYFSDAIPSKEIRLRGLRLLGREELLEESINLSPGCRVARLGFIPIGATSGGDVYVLDCESGRVYELSHEKYNESSISPGWKPDFSDFLQDVPITRANVIGTADRMFDDVEQFLEFLSQSDR